MKKHSHIVTGTALFVLVLSLMAQAQEAAIPGPEVSVFLSPLAGPPEGAIQLLTNPGFEQYPWGTGWSFWGEANLTADNPHSGEVAMWQGSFPSAFGWAEQPFGLESCEAGPVWVRAAYLITTADPLDPTQAGYDVTEGWIQNEAGLSVVDLWQRYDYDDTGWEWLDPWIRVEGLTEACVTCTLTIASSVNGNPDSVTQFLYDDVEAWCVPSIVPTPTPELHRVYLPVVVR